MPFDTTILEKKIQVIRDATKNGQFADALVGAINTGSGLMQQRIFTKTADVEGNSFGVYIGKKRKAKLIKSKNATQNKRNQAIAGQFLTSYQLKRARKGRQVLKKDLEFTGALRRAIETQVENEFAVVLQFNNTEAAKIAHGQEQQIFNIRNGGKGTTEGIGAVKIFALNETEKKQVVEQGHLLITQIIKKAT